jgi:hypothetical protein
MSMNHLFFANADTVLGSSTTTAFSAKMLRTALPSDENKENQKQKGKPLKWNQEEKHRRAIFRLSKLDSKTAIPTRPLEQATDASCLRDSVSELQSVSSIRSTADDSDDVSDITSPCTADSTRSSNNACEDVEMRRQCLDGSAWNCIPEVAGSPSPGIMSYSLFSPVLQNSRMSPLEQHSLLSSLNASLEHGSRVDSAVADEPLQSLSLDGETAADSLRARFSTGNWLHAETQRAEGAGPSLEGVQSCADQAAAIKSEGRDAVVGRADETVLPQQDACSEGLDTSEELNIMNAWFLLQARKLELDFPCAPQRGPDKVSVAMCLSEHASGASWNSAAATAITNQEKDAQDEDQGSRAPNAPILIYPTLHAALAIFSSQSQVRTASSSPA